MLQETKKKKKKRKGKNWREQGASLFPFRLYFEARCTAVVTRDMITGLYIGITIPRADRQIAVDKAYPVGTM